MKILFVEDELSKNIPRIKRLFSQYIGKILAKKLEDIENDESGYGAEPSEVKALVEETNFIDVEYRFPDALRRIIQHGKKYSLFISETSETTISSKKAAKTI